MWLLKYPRSLLLTIVTFFYRLLRDWWFGQWGKLRPAFVSFFGWGTVAGAVMALFILAPALSGAILNLIFAIAVLCGVIYMTLYGLHRGGKKKKK